MMKGNLEISNPANRALVLHPVPGRVRATNPADQSLKLEEAAGLALAIDLEIAAAEIVESAQPNPATFLGKGKVEGLSTRIEELEAGLVIMNCALSPIQQRNLERAWKVKVIDRTGLILEIFGQRAETKEGALQVELAHLTYQKSRLVRTWTHLERQRGGFGFLGGPGERQIEADRRQIQGRITRLKKDLEAVANRRALHRKARRQVPYPIIALAGYTNAGKSTLFNRLTGAAVDAGDKLFATLDPTLRAIRLPGGRKVILSDTVGFISDLPTELVAAFRATLEEVREADLILHVIDAANPEWQAQKQDVLDVLKALEVDDQIPLREVFNKADLLPRDGAQALERQSLRRENLSVISALKGAGVDGLLAAIEHIFEAGEPEVAIVLAGEVGKARAWLCAHGRILREGARRGEATLTARLGDKFIGQFKKEFPGCRVRFIAKSQKSKRVA